MRLSRVLPLAAVALAGLAACADYAPTGVAPSSASAAPGWVADAFVGRPVFSTTTYGDVSDAYWSADAGAVTVATSGDTTYARFVVQPGEEQRYSFGNGHSIYFPKRAICDPARSSYGPAHWNSPCALTTKGVTVTLRSYVGADGHPRAEFWPQLRFNPELSTGVLLRFKDAAAPPSPVILFCPVDGSVEGCTDEALTDASLKTYRNADGTVVYRRVKHFSGYSVGVGRSSEY